MSTANATAPNPLERLNDTIEAIHALTWMLHNTIRTGDDFADCASGIHTILTQQERALEGVYNDLHVSQAASAATPAKALRVVEPIGINSVRVTEPDGRMFITTPELAGVASTDTPVIWEEDATATATELRNRFIAEKVKEGVDVKDIAQAVNLRRAAVERIARQLQGEEPETPAEPATKPATGRKAS
ncbi:hypothetical protein [Paradevosia shaoguanensis]|uniref:Uncharacterized protein n=1 Tax=Paradevosia shaoguanensis TaxID=1335043 RepID=A0AA41UBZ9_9HYPH|nr:hypothetical protein [Paradevosia shaoguanensis]MCF1741261.1 hypothetical protein [Paradevosia shaoguanensis]MCI0125744.1 hypothetical protein [Paradevosia shaoguanensis]